MKMKTDYRETMKRYRSERERYFPAIAFLLKTESRTDRDELPVKISDPELIAVVLELIDVGYADGDVFYVKKYRGDITGLYYQGGYPLTEGGLYAYRQFLHDRRGKLIRWLMILTLLVLVIILYYMMIRN